MQVMMGTIVKKFGIEPSKLVAAAEKAATGGYQ
jgi:hypothetical protein